MFRSQPLASVLALICGSGVLAQERLDPLPKSQPELPIFTEEREAAALVFVKKNQPEMLDVLTDLKDRNPEEYRTVIRAYFRDSEQLTDVRQRDPGQYEFMREMWKVQSRMQLLVAQLVGNPEKADDLSKQLRQVVAKRIDQQIELMDQQAERLKKQLQQIERQRQEIRASRDQQIEAKIQAVIEAVEKQRKAKEARGESDGGLPPKLPASR